MPGTWLAHMSSDGPLYVLISQVEYCLYHHSGRYFQHYELSKLHTPLCPVSVTQSALTQLVISSWVFINPLLQNLNTKAQHGGAHFNVLIKNPAKDESPHSRGVQSCWAVRRSRRDGQFWLVDTKHEARVLPEDGSCTDQYGAFTIKI